ncbi:MAG TPA: ABC transporter permease [Streptosporangiaceae bacterium]|nr:ABC transporter permease [Streptosporangiaceae bacterium]
MAISDASTATLAPGQEQSAAPKGRYPVLRFLVGRVSAALLTLLIASMLIFLATNVLPGNAAVVVLGRNARLAQVHKLEAELGLNHSELQRYATWLGQMAHGNFGKSAVAVAEGRTDSAISSTLASPLSDSGILAGLTALLLIPLTLALGTLAGLRAGRRVDHAISVPALVAGGLPEFVTGTALIFVFFTVLKLLPAVALLSPGQSPFSDIKALVLPVLTLLAVAVGAGVRQVRAGMIEVLQQDFILFARLNGIPERKVILQYALRNALAPSVQIIAQNLQYLVGGIIIVESVFTYPGIGTYLVQAVTSRDVTEVQAAAMILATFYVAINIAADLIVIFLVPKLRTGLL